MKLRYTPISPFARKVRVFAAEAGLGAALQCQPADVWADDSDIWNDNPFGSVPVLIGADGMFVGSWLCCEYLDSQHHGEPLIPISGARRWQVRQLHALADGIMQATVAHVTERLRRPVELVYPGCLRRQERKISNALVLLCNVPDSQLQRVDVATITLACALRYLQLRLPEPQWERQCPALRDWYRQFASRPSMLDSDFQP
jgi:glutathione S-transferase